MHNEIKGSSDLSALERINLKQEFKSNSKSKNNIINNDKCGTQYLLDINAFHMGAIAEFSKIKNLIYNKKAQSLFLDIIATNTVAEATPLVNQFLSTLSRQKNYIEDPLIKGLFVDAPIFSILFLDASKNKLGRQLKKYMYSTNSREQVILYSMMTLSYFQHCTTSEKAKEHINNTLKQYDFDILNEANDFDYFVIKAQNQEEKINFENNTNSAIGGMKTIARLLCE